MKICIIAFADLTGTPYLKTYTDIFDKENIKYDVIYWDRKGLNQKLLGGQAFGYEKKLEDNELKCKKAIYMIGYSLYVKSILRNNHYDYVIVLTSLLGILMSGYLVKRYFKKYIFDIRDYSYEHIYYYKRKMDILMKNSLLNVISSPDFKEFLPERKTILCHNCNFKEPGLQKFSKRDYPLKIGYVGKIRYKDECQKFLLHIKNDKRIIFEFYGDGEDENNLKKFCAINNINNTVFYGKYEAGEKKFILKNIDIIYNGYGNKLNNVKYALSNKYYDALYYKKPIIVNQGTSMEKLSQGFSYVIDYEKNIPDTLCSWYEAISPEQFVKTCIKTISSIIKDNEKFEQEILGALNQN